MDLLQTDIAHYKELLRVVCDNNTTYELMVSRFIQTIELAQQHLWK